MCDATAIGNFSMGAQGVGTIAQAYANYQKSALEKQGYEYQSAVARNNALMAEWQAQDAITRGQQTANAVQLRTAQLEGAQRAAFASRHVALDEGSALNILADTQFMGSRDAAMAEYNGQREAWAARNNARNTTSNADFLAWRAAQESPLLSAGSTLLTGAGKVATSWYALKGKGTSSDSMWSNDNRIE